MKLNLGIKSDPIQYRYSYPWLFRLMAEEGVTCLQLGSFFELYQLPDAWFKRLRKEASDHGIAIESVLRRTGNWEAFSRKRRNGQPSPGAITSA
jgi:ribulose-phosphate 3-epimerase